MFDSDEITFGPGQLVPVLGDPRELVWPLDAPRPESVLSLRRDYVHDVIGIEAFEAGLERVMGFA